MDSALSLKKHTGEHSMHTDSLRDTEQNTAVPQMPLYYIERLD